MVPSRLYRPRCVLLVLLGLGASLAPLRGEDRPDPAAGLEKALQDDNALVRKRAARGLERLGEKAKPAVPALEKALKDSDADVRAAAAAALERIDAPHALATLVRRVSDRRAEGKLRAEACKELGERFGSEPAAVRALEAALTDPIIKLDAARALEMSNVRQKQKSSGDHPGTRVALLNLKYVVMNYKKWTRFTDKLKGEYKRYESRVNEINARMDRLKKEEEAATDPDEKAKIGKRAKKLKQQAQELADEAKEELGKKESAELVVIYKEITQVVTEYARENDLDLVMHFNDAINDAEMVSPQNIQRKMVTGPATPLYMKPGAIDISGPILERLNDRYASTAQDGEK
jgi:Skp family chaperone for outer membrane proteins